MVEPEPSAAAAPTSSAPPFAAAPVRAEAARVAVVNTTELSINLLAFDPGDATGWALVRLGADGAPVILAAGAFGVYLPVGEGFVSGADDKGAMRQQMLAAVAQRTEHTEPELPAQFGKTSKRAEPGAAARALIAKLRPNLIACEWIYKVFPKAHRVQTSEGPINKSMMSSPMVTGLYRDGVIAGAIRAAALAAGVPVVHASAAQARRGVLGTYRAKISAIRAAVARVRTERGELPIRLGTTHARDAAIVALFALLSTREEAPAVEAGDDDAPEPTTTTLRRGRPPKVVTGDVAEPIVKRPRGRPRTRPITVPRPRGRPRKVVTVEPLNAAPAES